jgi:hypothetical protein
VLLGVLAALMPWGATSTSEFASRAMFAVVIAVVLSVVTRYGLELLVRRSGGPQSSVTHRSSVSVGTIRIGLWPLLKYSFAAALAADLIGVVVGTIHVLSPTAAFFLAVIVQQVTFVGAEILVAKPSGQSGKTMARVAALMGLVVMAILFAKAGNIIFVAQQPPALPEFTDSTNLLFAFPALLVGVAGITLAVVANRN